MVTTYSPMRRTFDGKALDDDDKAGLKFKILTSDSNKCFNFAPCQKEFDGSFIKNVSNIFMSTAEESVKTYWLFTIISLVATLGLLFTWPEWFWVTLPFLCTYFVKAMRWM